MEFTLASQPVRLAMQSVATRAAEMDAIKKMNRADSECNAIQIASQPRPSHSSHATTKRQLPAREKDTWDSTEYLAYQFLHLHLEDKMLPKGQGMLGSQVSGLAVRDTPGLDNSPGVGETGDNLRRPDSKEKHAAPVEAPPDMRVDQPSQHESFQDLAHNQSARSAHSVVTGGPTQPN